MDLGWFGDPEKVEGYVSCDQIVMYESSAVRSLIDTVGKVSITLRW